MLSSLDLLLSLASWSSSPLGGRLGPRCLSFFDGSSRLRKFDSSVKHTWRLSSWLLVICLLTIIALFALREGCVRFYSLLAKIFRSCLLLLLRDLFVKVRQLSFGQGNLLLHGLDLLLDLSLPVCILFAPPEAKVSLKGDQLVNLGHKPTLSLALPLHNAIHIADASGVDRC